MTEETFPNILLTKGGKEERGLINWGGTFARSRSGKSMGGNSTDSVWRIFEMHLDRESFGRLVENMQDF